MSIHRLATLCLVALSIISCGGATDVGPVIRVLLDADDAALEVGKSRQLTATVEGLTAGQATGVDFTSSAATIATVDANGLVQAVAPGSATITATAKADSRATATVQFTITPAAVAIAITSIVSAATGQPVDPADVSGTIRVNTNVIMPAGATGTLEAYVGSTLVATQQAIGTGSRVVSLASDLEVAAAPITLSFNTAQLDDLNQPKFFNGATTISARVITPTGVASSISSPVTLNNRNLIYIDGRTTQPPVNDQSGQPWTTGPVTVRAYPVLYGDPGTAGVVNIVTIAATLPNNQVITKTDNTPADGFNFVLDDDVTPANGGLSDFQGLVSVTATSTTASGSAGPQGGPYAFRHDNWAPVATMTVPLNRWINASYKFDHTALSTTNPDAGGVGGTLAAFFARRNQLEGSVFQPVTRPEDLSQTLDVNSYIFRMRLTDLVGRVRNVDVNNLLGVDWSRPLTSVASGSVRWGQINPGAGSFFGVDVTDQFSGVFETHSDITTWAPNGTTSCAFGVFNPMTNGCDKIAGPTQLPVPTGPGYHWYYTRSSDVALNWSTQTRLGVIQDAVNPQLGTHTISAAPYGGPVAFTAPASDDLDVKSINYLHCYNISGVRGCFAVDQLIASAFGPPLVKSASLTSNVNFAPGIERASSSGTLEGTIHVADAILYDVLDQANNFQTRTITIPQIDLGPRSAPFGTRGVQNFQIIAPVANASYGVGDSNAPACAAGVQGLIDVDAQIRVTSGTVNPFTSVSFDLTDGRNISRILGRTSIAATSTDGITINYRVQRNFGTDGFDISPQQSVTASLSATATSSTGALRSAPRLILLLNCKVVPPVTG